MNLTNQVSKHQDTNIEQREESSKKLAETEGGGERKEGRKEGVKGSF